MWKESNENDNERKKAAKNEEEEIWKPSIWNENGMAKYEERQHQ